MSEQNMRRLTKVAAIQLQCTDNIEHNMNKITSLIKQVEKTGAEMAFLPESFDFIRSSPDQPYKLSDFLTGSVIQRMKSLARDSKMWLSLGGFQTKFYIGEKVSERLKNTHIVINSDGEIVSTYEKLNMFDLSGVFMESESIDPGVTLTPPVKTPVGNVGLQICYDLRFPEFATMLRKMGADIIAYPAAFTYQTGKAHWEILLKSRAVETQSYVVAANQTGWHNDKLRSFGNSMIVDPWGQIVARCGEEVGFIVADIDHELISKIRNRMPCFRTHRVSNYFPNSMCWNPRQIEDNFVFNFGEVSIGSNQVFLLTQFSVAFINSQSDYAGHVLVSPLRQGVLGYSQLSFDELVDLNYTVQRVGDIVEKHFEGTSVSIIIQNGQSHVHIIPRQSNDSLLDLQSTNSVRTDDQLLNESLSLRKYF